jgi:hypothetical protein
MDALVPDTKNPLTVLAFGGRLFLVIKPVGRLQTLPRWSFKATWRLSQVALVFRAKVSGLFDVL